MPPCARHPGPTGVFACVILAAMGCGRPGTPTPVAAPAPETGRVAALAVPPPPDGSPAELLAYVMELQQRPIEGASREEVMAFFAEVAAASEQAADRILAQVRPGEKFHAAAAQLKLEALGSLARRGDERAAAALSAFAGELMAGPDADLAREARRQLIAARAGEAFGAGDVEEVFGLVKTAVELLASDPADGDSAELCMRMATRLERMDGAAARAIDAYRLIGAEVAKSSEPGIRGLARSCLGAEVRLGLPGKPMELGGTLLDGTPFDQRTLAGKVVLVDFWATWCGPCVAEMPNIRAQYEKYHDRGLEVVGISLDDDRAAVAAFVAENGIPWPVICGTGEESGWDHPLVVRYGIGGIPALFLIGRDGNVIDVNVSGESLADRLAALFTESPDR
jgi:thiol-disulfide isomerase/thioredoxin